MVHLTSSFSRKHTRALMEIMSQGPDANRRKSRLATSLFKRSFGAGGILARSTLGSNHTSTTPTTAGSENILFGSIRNQGSSSDQNPFRRSIMRANSNDMSQSQPPQQQQLNQQQVSLPLTEVRPISKELEDPIATLCVAVDQLVEKMTVVADIHKGLASFNESFGSFLYGLQMNASTVEWSEVSTGKIFTYAGTNSFVQLHAAGTKEGS